MQYTHLLTSRKKSALVRLLTGAGVRWLMAVCVLGLIAYQLVTYQADLSTILTVWSGAFSLDTIWLWGLAICLMVLNWSLEALKWQLLAGKVAPISFLTAFRSVLAGLSLSAILPHTFGEYAGRIGAISHNHKIRLIGPLWVSHTAQMAITCLAGAFGLATYLAHRFSIGSVEVFALAGVGLTLAVLAGLILSLPSLSRLTRRFKAGKAIEAALALGYADWVKALFLSTLRYTCFLFQFFLMLHLLGLHMPLQYQLAGITWVFLIKSWAPALNIVADLGVRELAALSFFPLFGGDPAIVLMASLSVWFLNLFVPSVAGSISLLRLPLCKSD